MLNCLISPAERYDLLVGFSGMPMGTDITLANYNAPVHLPGGGGPEITEMMQFRVTKPLPGGGDPTTPDTEPALPAVPPIPVDVHTRRREFVLYRHVLFGTMTLNAVPFMEPSEDFIKLGSKEIWEYINPNHGAHPAGGAGGPVRWGGVR
ncbi:hypothetical protein [Kitasatospora camelliae]|uniref:Uncharacterized protein n=1 Tax=Kitasatospora camelliae TaxID=3156397 RepID=A0AAU8K810_9ACTN